MAHTITFAHFKGGTGKTTSCLSIAGFLARYGAKVLAVDLDPQANLTAGLGIDNSKLKSSMCHIMAKRKSMNDVIIETGIQNLSLAPATPYLVHTTLRKYETKEDAQILKKALQSVEQDYDFILIDTPPSNGHFIVNGVTAADSVVLVLDPGAFALQGINTFNTIFKSYCSKMGFDLNIEMALLTKHRKSFNPFRKGAGKEIKTNAEEILGKKVFTIPLSGHIYESQKRGLPISHHRPYSGVGLAYMKVAEELIKLKD